MSKLSNYFKGDDRDREVMSRADVLKMKKQLRGADKKTLAEAEAISRRLFLRRAGVSVATLAAMTGVGAFAVKSGDKEKSAPTFEGMKEKKEVLDVDRMIREMDQGVKLLRRWITDLRQYSGLSSEEMETVLRPLEIYDRNRENNEQRNFLALEDDAPQLEDVTGKKIKDRNLLFSADGRNFYFSDVKYSTSSRPEDTVAGFQPMSRVVYINPVFDPEKLVDLIGLYHELVHVVQDDDERVKFSDDNFKIKDLDAAEKYLNAKRSERAKLDTEAGAYVLQLELMNILMGGYFRELAKVGWDTTKLTWQMPEFFTNDPKNRGMFVDLVKGSESKRQIKGWLVYAKEFFPEGIKAEKLSDEFLRAIAKTYHLEFSE